MKKSKTKTVMVHKGTVNRSTQGLRNALFDEIDALRAGKTTPLMANSTAKMVREIVNTVHLELNVAKFINRSSNRAPKFTTLTLGT